MKVRLLETRNARSSRTSTKPQVEIYDCGCKVEYSQVDVGEWEGDLPEKFLIIPELMACVRHGHNGRSIPPKDARLVTVLHEHESFLNE